jgi:hypothetical protein
MSGTGANLVKAEDIASKAASLVSGDRAVTHGDKAANLGNIATIWNAWFRMTGATELTGADVAELMELLKVARRHSGTYNVDDYIDGAGYAAVTGELRQPCAAPIPDTEPFVIKATYTPIGTKR